MARENIKRRRVAANPPIAIERWMDKEERTRGTSRNLLLIAGLVALRSLPSHERDDAFTLASHLNSGLLKWDRFCQIQEARGDAVRQALEIIESAVLRGIPAEELEQQLAQNGRRRKKK